MKKIVLPFITSTLLLMSCETVEKENTDHKKECSAEENTKREVAVHWYGALKNMMHNSDLSTHVNLQELSKEHNYALGALEDLKGEVLIWNGQPLISKILNEHVIIDSSWDHKAALLVTSNVAQWQSISVPSSVKDMEALTIFIKDQATENNIDVGKPFPFLIKGKVDSLQWHIIDWPEGDTVHTHEKHVTSGAYGTNPNIDVDILGFHSTKHKGIFTHHSSDVHMHFKTEHYPYAGHVDNLYFNEAEIFLPK